MGKKSATQTDATDEIIEADEEIADLSPETPRTARQLRTEAYRLKNSYDDLNVQVGQASKLAVQHEQKLIAEVKVKVQAYAGDVDAMKIKKRDAYMADEAADRAAKDAEEREGVT